MYLRDYKLDSFSLICSAPTVHHLLIHKNLCVLLKNNKLKQV